jgi:hypothetical protein
MRCAGRVACLKTEKKIEYLILILTVIEHFGDKGAEGKIILERILQIKCTDVDGFK